MYSIDLPFPLKKEKKLLPDCPSKNSRKWKQALCLSHLSEITEAYECKYPLSKLMTLITLINKESLPVRETLFWRAEMVVNITDGDGLI